MAAFVDVGDGSGSFLVSNAIDVNVEPAVAFTVGLLHDIGKKLVLNQVLTPEYQKDIRARMTDKGLSRAEAEKEVLGTDHGEVGGALLQAWHLPDDIIEAVANHHHPVVEPSPKLSAVANVANCVAHLVGSGPGWETLQYVRVDPRVAEAFGLTPERIERIMAEVRESCSAVDQLMSMA